MIAMAETEVLLSLDELEVRFPFGHNWRGRPKGYIHALNGVSLNLRRGETLGLVGESGCGKSTLAQVLLRLVQPTGGRLEGVAVKGNTLQMQIIFQDPMSSLDPRMRVWQIITEPVIVREKRNRKELRVLAAKLSEQVGLRPEYLDRFPHEFSGGQRQRIAIARALAPDPEVLILDEPTSALDVSVQAQVLNLLSDLQRERGLTYLFISHDVSVIRHMSNRVAIMYLGQVVELGKTKMVLSTPRHPYTRMLLDAVPRIGQSIEADEVNDNIEIPSNRTLPSGCFFRERCPSRTAGCEEPQLLSEAGDGSKAQVRCHYHFKRPNPSII